MTAFTVAEDSLPISTNMCIYTITHVPTGRLYVGQTIRKAAERWRGHCSTKSGNGRSAIKSAICKHGILSFIFSVVDSAQDQNELDQKERLWITKLSSMAPLGFNLSLGGVGAGKHSNETKKKISLAHKGKKLSDAHRAALRGRPGRVWTDEQLEGLRQKNLGKTITEECRKKISEALKGKIGSTKGRKLSPEHIKKLSDVKRGKPGPRLGQRNALSSIEKARQTKKKNGKLCHAHAVKRSDGKTYPSVLSAALDIGAHPNSVSDVLRHRRNSVFGFNFNYLGDVS